MPEGPQMLFFNEQLEQFAGKKIIEANGDAKEIPMEKLSGQIIKEVKAFGKELLFCFPEFTIRVHLMLFGKLAINSKLNNRALKLGFQFEDAEVNFYACNCKFLEGPADNHYDWSKDVLSDKFKPQKAAEALSKKPKELICEALLDQNILAGVGNKLKNEALFKRKIHPESVVAAIPNEEIKHLVDECVEIGKEYLSWLQQGEDNQWRVYKKDTCPRDGNTLRIEKIGKSKRTNYFCEKCQELYSVD